MVIGTAGELPKPPDKPIVFLEGLCPGLQASPHGSQPSNFFYKQIWKTLNSQKQYGISFYVHHKF
jgi:hypothetical protein